MGTILDAALSYAERGWAVFPLRPREKIPFAGTQGFKDATCDAGRIRESWGLHPTANVGIATGKMSGLTVVDVDPKNGGDATLLDLQREHGRLPDTVTVSTGSGGFHFYFADAGVGNSASRIGKGVDVRGVGGYVVAPPSIHPSGRTYEFFEDAAPGVVGVVGLPTWLLEKVIVRRSSDTQANRDKFKQMFVNGSVHGRQAHDLAAMSGYLFRSNLPPTFVREILRLWIKHRFERVDSMEQAEQIIESIALRELQRQSGR